MPFLLAAYLAAVARKVGFAIKLASWDEFFRELQQDCKLFVFVLALFTLFRIAFIVILHSFMSDAATWEDIGTALYYGLRLSLKSTGLLILAPLLCCTGLRLIFPWRRLEHLRYYLGAAYVVVLSFLFHARLPYYQEFRVAFNQLLFNTVHDDVMAIIYTVIEQYNLPLRFVLACATAWALCRLLKRLLTAGTFSFPKLPRWYLNLSLRAVLLVGVYYFAIFVSYGGTMDDIHNLDWENAGVTRDQLLNEAILDDMHALYRAYILHERIASSTGLFMDPQKLGAYGNYVAGREVDSKEIDDFLRRKVVVGQAAPPRHVFFIVSESYANWPLLPQYKYLNIANGVKRIIEQDNAAYSPNLLPNGLSTISGVMGIVAGFADANLYLNQLPDAYQEPYSTALAAQMKRLGYKSDFWYAGPSSWEKIREFTLAQGFDAFYGKGDLASESGNVWGCDDRDLYQAVLGRIQDDQPGFHMILNVSNHSPYTVDLDAEGYDRAAMEAILPEKAKQDPEMVKKLGHFWYADKMLSQFVAEAKKRYPDSVFVIVGDHADRLNLDVNPTMYERYAIPLVVYGKGIHKEAVPETAAGSHINLTATLMELIAPPGFEYYAIGPSLTRGSSFGINYGFWITADYIGDADSGERCEPHSARAGIAPPDAEKIRMEVDSARGLSWWRIKYGKTLRPLTEADN